MKKALSIIVMLILVLSLCACGESDGLTPTERAVQDAVQQQATFECYSNYTDVGGVAANITNTTDMGNDTYSVQGVVIVSDMVNNYYDADFDATVVVDENGKGLCSYFYMDTLESAYY